MVVVMVIPSHDEAVADTASAFVAGDDLPVDGS